MILSNRVKVTVKEVEANEYEVKSVIATTVTASNDDE